MSILRALPLSNAAVNDVVTSERTSESVRHLAAGTVVSASAPRNSAEQITAPQLLAG